MMICSPASPLHRELLEGRGPVHPPKEDTQDQPSSPPPERLAQNSCHMLAESSRLPLSLPVRGMGWEASSSHPRAAGSPGPCWEDRAAVGYYLRWATSRCLRTYQVYRAARFCVFMGVPLLRCWDRWDWLRPVVSTTSRCGMLCCCR